ncbi:MAG: hypothetical protein KME09_00230 [Pleurocapsa minor HA4230-MV1]|jgi:hypothetical protein|nr:hypothetical protein [Pleurocapsa minor HA4230-MV1]
MEKEERLEEAKQLKEDLSFLNGTLLDEFLMHKPKEVQRRVRKTVEIWKIDHNDPFFLILLQCGITQILYELFPNEIHQAFDHGRRELVKVIEESKAEFLTDLTNLVEQQERLALNISTAKINTEIHKILKEINHNQGETSFTVSKKYSFLKKASCLIALCSFGVGFFVNETAIAKERQQNIARHDRETLKWAKSKEGKVAKNIISWNDDLVDGSCKDKVNSLGLSFQLGNTKTTSGFCVVFVEPVERRETGELN